MIKVLLLTGCIAGLFLLSVPSIPAQEIESIFAMHINPFSDSITIDVLSMGCTNKHSFAFDLAGDVLTIIRIAPDQCKMAPHRMTLTYTGEDVILLRGRTFRLNNPISFTTGREQF